MTYQDLKIGDIVHMEYYDGDEVYTVYSHVTDIQTDTITFNDLYCDKGPTFKDYNYPILFPEPSFTFLSVVGNLPTADVYFQSLFPELSL